MSKGERLRKPDLRRRLVLRMSVPVEDAAETLNRSVVKCLYDPKIVRAVVAGVRLHQSART